jgi:hypothetical protein
MTPALGRDEIQRDFGVLPNGAGNASFDPMDRARSLASATVMVVTLVAAPALADAADPILPSVVENALYHHRTLPDGIAPEIRARPAQILDRFRAIVATFGPGVTAHVSEGATVVTAWARDASQRVELLVSDPAHRSSPMVVLNLHVAIPGGLAEVERKALHPYGQYGARYEEGSWDGGRWREVSHFWQALGKDSWLVVESKRIGMSSFGRTRSVAERGFLVTPKGQVPVSKATARRLRDTIAGGYRLRSAPHFVQWSQLRSAGIHPVIDPRGRHYLRRTRGAEGRLCELGITFVGRSRTGARAHIRGSAK